jgi:hypothetical protein
MVRKVCGWLVLGAWLAAACGGRAIDDGNEPQEAGGTGGKGKPSGKAGSAPFSTAGAPITSGGSGIGVGAAPGTGGTYSAGGSAPAFGGTGFVTGGTSASSTGGSVTCPCDPIECAPGYGQGPGPGCCPVCVPIDYCTAVHAQYDQQRDLLLEKYSSVGCKFDSDCGVLYESNACKNTCGQTPLPIELIDDAVQNLDGIAREICAKCPPPPIPPCVPPPAPRCVMNRCSFIER